MSGISANFKRKSELMRSVEKPMPGSRAAERKLDAIATVIFEFRF